MINKLDLLWLPNFIALGIYFILGIKFSWNEGTDTCFNVKCVLLGRNFDFLGGYLVVTARYLVITPGYYSLLGGYWWLLLVTARYCLFPILMWTFSMILRIFLKLIIAISSRMYFLEEAVHRCCTKNVFLKFSQHSQAIGNWEYCRSSPKVTMRMPRIRFHTSSE